MLMQFPERARIHTEHSRPLPRPNLQGGSEPRTRDSQIAEQSWVSVSCASATGQKDGVESKAPRILARKPRGFLLISLISTVPISRCVHCHLDSGLPLYVGFQLLALSWIRTPPYLMILSDSRFSAFGDRGCRLNLRFCLSSFITHPLSDVW